MGLGDVVVASTAVRTVLPALRAASEGALVWVPVRAARVTHASPGPVLACVLAAVKASVVDVRTSRGDEISTDYERGGSGEP